MLLTIITLSALAYGNYNLCNDYGYVEISLYPRRDILNETKYV